MSPSTSTLWDPDTKLCGDYSKLNNTHVHWKRLYLATTLLKDIPKISVGSGRCFCLDAEGLKIPTRFPSPPACSAVDAFLIKTFNFDKKLKKKHNVYKNLLAEQRKPADCTASTHCPVCLPLLTCAPVGEPTHTHPHTTYSHPPLSLFWTSHRPSSIQSSAPFPSCSNNSGGFESREQSVIT